MGSVSEHGVACGDCGKVLDEALDRLLGQRAPCPMCGSTKRHKSLTIESRIEAKSMLGYKAKSQGKGKPFIEGKVGDDLHRKTGIWNRLRRVIDRRNNRYEETITGPDGTVIREVAEPLTDHQGRGSAKKRKQ